MRSAEEWAKIAVDGCPQNLPRWTHVACEDCVAEIARAYARECVEAWREKAATITERRGCTKVACGPSGHTYPGCPHNIAAALRALPGETP